MQKEFCDRVNKQSEGAEIVVVGFEWYSDVSLKAMAWESRQKGKKKRNNYIIEPDTDLSKRCMEDILGTTQTKKSVTTLLMNALENHLIERKLLEMVLFFLPRLEIERPTTLKERQR